MWLRLQVPGCLPATFVAWLAIGLVGCATAPVAPKLPRANAFSVSEAQFRQEIRRLCLDPISSEVEIAESVERLASIETEIAARLTAGGFEVVASSESGKLVEAIEDELGPAFDPHTGRVYAISNRGVLVGVRLIDP